MDTSYNKSTKTSSKERLLKAAIKLIRTQGYHSTTVDELCSDAGVSKGTFFHYFANKESLAIEAVDFWTKTTEDFFKSASYNKFKDPLQRFLGYIDFRKQILTGALSEFTCLVGTMTQEVFISNPEITKSCKKSIFSHASTLENDIEDAKNLYTPKAKWSTKSLALHTQSVIQGSFILAKASGTNKEAIASLNHLKNYIKLIFNKK